MHKTSDDTLNINTEAVVDISIDLADLTNLTYRNELDDSGNILNRTALEYGDWDYRQSIIVDMPFEEFNKLYLSLIHPVML